jgi:endonuclease YncB( thermonuclease family)
MFRLIAPAFAAILATVASGCAEAQQRCRAVDGDTLACGAERVRVMGLDAPEMRGSCPAEVRMARAARDRMEALVAGGVSLQPHGRDRYRRLLAVVRDRQGRDVAAVMIREGLARPYGGEARRSWCG